MINFNKLKNDTNKKMKIGKYEKSQINERKWNKKEENLEKLSESIVQKKKKNGNIFINIFDLLRYTHSWMEYLIINFDSYKIANWVIWWKMMWDSLSAFILLKKWLQNIYTQYPIHIWFLYITLVSSSKILLQLEYN